MPETSPIVVLGSGPDPDGSPASFLRSLGYPVRVGADSADALEAVRSENPELLLLELATGEGSGIEVARQALELDPDLAIVIMSGGGSEAAAAECLRLGVSDYLINPFDLEALGRTVQRALFRRSAELRRFRSEERLRHRIAELQTERRTGALRALGEVVWSHETKHAFLRGHSLRVADVAAAVAQELGLPKAAGERLRVAGLLHDVGMIAVPDSALRHTGRLDAHDLEKVRSHPTLGAELVRAFGLTEVASLIETHHERLDGSGYPHGVRGSELRPGALILGLAEVYAALTESRPFREAGSPRNAIDTLRGVEGMWFPGAFIDALERCRPWDVDLPDLGSDEAAVLKLA